MSQAEAPVIKICPYQLAASEEAVIRRVVAFGQSQGRPYQLSELAVADWLIVSDDTEIPLAPTGREYRIIRVASEDTQLIYDLLMPRPLLLSRVMRILDQGSKLWTGDSITPESFENTTTQPSTISDARVDLPKASAETKSDLKSVNVSSTGQQQTNGALTEAQKQTDVVSQKIYKALVVDDSAAIRKQLELELKQAGIESDFAEDGLQALQKVEQHSYDLIFLDIIMPGMDGYEVCKQLRMQAPLKKTPIIMLSAKSSPLDEVQGVIAGASTYLTKPVKTQQLQKTLQRVARWLTDFRVQA